MVLHTGVSRARFRVRDAGHDEPLLPVEELARRVQVTGVTRRLGEYVDDHGMKVGHSEVPEEVWPTGRGLMHVVRRGRHARR